MVFVCWKVVFNFFEKGLYCTSVVKKKRYWPKGIPGEEIVAHLKEKEPGYV